MEDDVMHEQSAAYVLDALDPEERRAYEAHLGTCPRCRDEVALLSGATTMLAFAAPAAEPPPDLRSRILDAARAEQGNVIPLRPRASRVTRTLAAVAAVAATAALALVLVDRFSSGPDQHALALLGAQGSLVVGHGGQATLVVSGLPAAPPGKTYEAWVIRDGRAQPAGVFDASGQTVTTRLTRRVPDGAIVGVTIERAGGAEQPSGAPIFTSAPT
jgi:anti-sigma-K factor RskA